MIAITTSISTSVNPEQEFLRGDLDRPKQFFLRALVSADGYMRGIVVSGCHGFPPSEFHEGRMGVD